MSLITRLQRMGWLPAYFASEVDDAGDEDLMRAKIKHTEVSKQTVEAIERNHQANGSLLEAVRRVRSTSAFGDIERSVRNHGGRILHRDR
jgi:hypothetical protein